MPKDREKRGALRSNRNIQLNYIKRLGQFRDWLYARDQHFERDESGTIKVEGLDGRIVSLGGKFAEGTARTFVSLARKIKVGLVLSTFSPDEIFDKRMVITPTELQKEVKDWISQTRFSYRRGGDGVEIVKPNRNPLVPHKN